LTPNELVLSFLTPNDYAKFHDHQIQNCDRKSDDRHTDRQTPAILLSAPCYAIAMGQIIMAGHGHPRSLILVTIESAYRFRRLKLENGFFPQKHLSYLTPPLGGPLGMVNLCPPVYHTVKLVNGHEFCCRTSYDNYFQTKTFNVCQEATGSVLLLPRGRMRHVVLSPRICINPGRTWSCSTIQSVNVSNPQLYLVFTCQYFSLNCNKFNITTTAI